MPSFLLQYDRSAGRLTEKPKSYADGESAIRDRVRLERARASKQIEIVVIHGDSLQSIKRTHARYFKSNEQLIESMAKPRRARAVSRLRSRPA